MDENVNILVNFFLMFKIMFEYIFMQINNHRSQTKLHLHLDDNLLDPDINFDYATCFWLSEPCYVFRGSAKLPK